MWMKVDDQLHVHRKTRHVLRSLPTKHRDAAPLGVWLLAGSWAAQNNTGGWIPAEELDRFDDDWETLVARLVAADFWWPETRDGEAGFGFVDWDEYNGRDRESSSGQIGNHLRWHVARGIVKPGCEHCPNPPDSPPDIGCESPPTIAPESPPDIAPESRNIAQPEPVPEPDTRPQPEKPSPADLIADDFNTWWAHYPRKVGKGNALRAYKTARTKTDADTLLAGLAQQANTLQRAGTYCPHATTWLNGERWQDAPEQIAPPVTNRRQAETDDFFAEAARRAQAVDSLTTQGELMP